LILFTFAGYFSVLPCAGALPINALPFLPQKALISSMIGLSQQGILSLVVQR
jgi:hypothetical protein